MKVIIKAIPKSKPSLPQNRINPFSTPDEYKYGGRLEGRGSQNGVPIQAIDTYSDFLHQPMKENGYTQSPYHSTGKQLPDVPKEDNPDIVVELDEQIMGDFNGDGMPVLMGVNTGSHDSGNDQGVNVPDGSFVFSSTPSLKERDPQILEMFGKKKPSTYAEMAKQFDLQKYKKVLDDDQRDSIDKNTAKLMYGNYVNKLNLLASLQEAKKEKQNMMKADRQSIPGQMKRGGPGDKKINRHDDVFDVEDYPDYTQVPSQKGHTSSRRAAQGTVSAYPMYNPEWTNGVIPIAPTQGEANVPYHPDYIAPMPIYDGTTPYTPEPIAVSPMNSNYSLPALQGNSKQQRDHIPYMNNNSINPDTLAAITAGLRYGQYPNYTPVKQIAHAAIPQAVYADPTRAKAAIQEAANSAGNTIAMGATGPVARANILALQGKAGAQAADIEAQYAQKNVEIANRTNEQAAQIYNQLWKDQQGYNKDYAEETHNAQMDKLGYQFGVQNELLKQSYQAENRKRTAQNYNYINPYYTMNERGYIYPKSDAQLKALQSITGQPSSSGISTTPMQDAEAIIKQGNITDPDTIKTIRQRAAIMNLQQMQGPRQTRSYNPTTGGYAPSKETGYGDAFDYQQKRGGPIQKSTTCMKIIGLPSK